jgi:uncharacterized protein
MDQHVAAARRVRLRELFTDLITAYGAKDFDRFETFMRNDTVFEWPEKMVGGANFRATSEAGMKDCDPYGHVVDQFFDQFDPDTLIVEYHSDTIHHPTGRRYSNKYLGILRFEDEKVVYWKEYVNPLTILEVYGDQFRNSAVEEIA